MPFWVATYNVLATAYINPAWYAGVPEQLLQPAWRIPALTRHVAALNADIACLQEVEPDVFRALNQQLGPLGYTGRYEQKGRGKPDGSATFFRGSTFSLRQARRLEYRDRERGPEGHSGHVAQLLALEYQGDLLGVANTHIRWNDPGLPRDEQVGHRQVMELIEECRRFDPTCRGWVLCGDFNQEPNTEVVAAVYNAGYAFAHADHSQVRSAVANGRARLIDYIFHSRSLTTRPIEPPAISDDTKLPSPDQPSDHVALVAEIEWRTGDG